MREGDLSQRPDEQVSRPFSDYPGVPVPVQHTPDLLRDAPCVDPGQGMEHFCLRPIEGALGAVEGAAEPAGVPRHLSGNALPVQESELPRGRLPQLGDHVVPP